MHFSKSEVATYLFTATLPDTKTKSLTIIEWNMLVKVLTSNSLKPENLLELTDEKLNELLTECSKNQKESIVQKVSNRKHLGISMIQLEDLSNQGYEVIFRSKMPFRLKKLELKSRPAFYYSAGDINILNSQYTLGVVGSREANEEELFEIENICKQAAQYDIVIISGGAKGIDSTATSSVLKNGGRAVIFPSTGIGPLVKNKDLKKYIKNGQLLVLSTVPTYASFTGRYAMQRNKYIHSSSDAVLIGASQISNHKKSGTWEGVLENISSQWSPMYTIGNSKGVLELKKREVAKEFISLQEIYSQSKNYIDIFEKKLELLINEGLSYNIPKESIVNLFKKRIDCIDNKLEQSKNAQYEENFDKEQLDAGNTHNTNNEIDEKNNGNVINELRVNQSDKKKDNTLNLSEQEQIKLDF